MSATRGTRPPPAPVPAAGLWWVRTATAKFVVPDCYYDWDRATSAWVVCRVAADAPTVDIVAVEVLGASVGLLWAAQHRVVVEVGPRLDPPDALPEVAGAVEALLDLAPRNAAGQVTDRLRETAAGQKYALPPPDDRGWKR